MAPRGLNSAIRISICPPPDVAGILLRVSMWNTSITLRLHLMTVDRRSNPATIFLSWRLLVRIADSKGQLLGYTHVTPNETQGFNVLIVTERAVHSTLPSPAERRSTTRPHWRRIKNLCDLHLHAHCYGLAEWRCHPKSAKMYPSLCNLCALEMFELLIIGIGSLGR